MAQGKSIGQMSGIAKGLLEFGIIIGVAFLILGTFYNAIGGSNLTAQNAVGNVIGAFNGGVSTYLVPVVAIAFIAIIAGLAYGFLHGRGVI